MDWSRAKTILIGAFLLLNVFLGYQLWLNEQSEVDFARRAQGGIDLLEEMLVQNRITINGDIPLETPVMNNLEVSLIDLSQLERPFSNQAITMNESAILRPLKPRFRCRIRLIGTNWINCWNLSFGILMNIVGNRCFPMRKRSYSFK